MNRLQHLLQETEFERPLVMGVLNVTPDSFSDGGRFNRMDDIKARVDQMVAEGVDIIDIGGESTRPGAESVSFGEELDRVLPVLNWIKGSHDVLMSIDTYKPAVMRAAIGCGVDLVNDVNALQADGALEAVVEADVCVSLMHKQGVPKNMQDSPEYEDVVEEVITFLMARAEACRQFGVASDRIILDPGFGFGKTLNHNVRLFEELDRLVDLNYPTLIGVSRKKMIGQILAQTSELPVEERGLASVVASLLAAMKGVRILRVHDVKEMVQAIRIMQTLL